MSRCTDACRRPTASQAHCSVCHRTFGGVRGFDKHRHNGACLEPTALGMTDRDGIWVRPMGATARFPVPGDAVEPRTPVVASSPKGGDVDHV